MRKNHQFAHCALAAGLVFLCACGGGGGGGASAPVQPSPTYSGSAAPATLTNTDDVAAISLKALGGASAVGVSLGAQTSANMCSQVELAWTLAGARDLVTREGFSAAGSTINQSVSGTCGGSAVLTGTDSSTPNHINVQGTITFSNYCSTSASGTNSVLNGTAAFSMTGASSADYNFSMSSSRISISESGLTYVYSLSYSCQFSYGPSAQVALSAVYLAPNGKTYKIENYHMTADSTALSLAISGRFFDPDYGYVDVTTPSAIYYSYCSNGGVYRPTSGRLVVTCANGYGEFIANDCYTYSLDMNGGPLDTRSW